MPCNLSSLLIPQRPKGSVLLIGAAKPRPAASRNIRASVILRRYSKQISRGVRPRQQSQISEAK